MAAWIKMPLGMEVGLGSGDFGFDADPAPPEKRPQLPYPIFGPCLLWPNGWMDEDAAWYGNRPCPGHTVLDGDGPSSAAKGAQQPTSLLGPMSIVATIAHLSYC